MNTPMHSVLVAEDEETDRFILQRAFGEAKLNCPLIMVSDGQEAIDYLSGQGDFSDRALHPLPALLLMDLKMPRMTGFDVLTWLASRPELKALPVLVLTSSAHESDIQKAKELGARDYIVKPHEFRDFVKMIRAIGVRWLQVPDLPASS